MADLGIGEALALVGTLAGAGLGVAGAEQTQSQMNNDVASTIAQEGAFQRQATPLYTSNFNQSKPAAVNTALNTDAAKALAQYAQVQQQPMTTAAAPAPTATSQVTGLREKAAVGQQNDAASKLASYGQQATDQSIANQETNNQLGMINTEAANTAALLPTELQTASSGAPLQAAGSLLSSLGGLYGSASAVSPLMAALKAKQGTGGFAPGSGSQTSGQSGLDTLSSLDDQ